MQSKFIYDQKEFPKKFASYGLILLLFGFGLTLIAYLVDPVRTLHNYIIMYMFLVGISVGAIFMIALEYIAGAEWSVPIRRMVEFTSSVTPYLLLIAVPLLLNVNNLFEWAHPEAAHEEALQNKAPYLNTNFFVIRNIVFYAIWLLFYYLFTNNSFKQDTNADQGLTKKNIKLSAVFIPLFAITITFTSIDWMMSLAPHWFSTIFGVYYFSGSVITVLAVVTIFTVYLKENNYLHPKINDDHLYSLGALMFGFVNFWAYIAFSQYLLIWYADLPEESFWFMARWHNNWWIVSILLVIVKFLVPYIVLLSQPAKSDAKKLKFVSFWLLAAQILDLYWLVMPNSSKDFYVSWIDFVCPIAAFGLILFIFSTRARKYSLLPYGDPKLERGLNFHL